MSRPGCWASIGLRIICGLRYSAPVRRTLAILGASLVLSCRPSTEATLTVPADVGVVGVWASGMGSQLTAWADGAPLPLVTPEAGPTYVVGFAPSQLAGLEDGWRQGSLRAPGPCEATLPTPMWAATLVEGVLSAVDPASAPPLTVEGLQAVCPRDAERLVLDVRGVDEICPTRVSQAGCALEASADCLPVSLAGWRWPDGGFCLRDVRAQLACEGRALDDEPLVCTDGALPIELDLRDTTPQPAPFEATTITIVDKPTFYPSLWRESNQLTAVHRNVGLAFDMVVLEDQAVVSHMVEGMGGGCLQHQDDGAFTFVDLDTVQVVRTATAPPCANFLVARPDRRGFYGLVLVEEQPFQEYFHLAEYDAQGSLLKSERLPGAMVGRPNPRGITVMPERGEIAVFLPQQQMASEVVVHSHRITDLSWVRTTTLAGISEVHDAARLGADRIIVATDLHGYATLDADDFRVLSREPFPGDNLYPGRFVSVTALGGDDALLTSTAPIGVALLRVRGAETTVRFPFVAGFTPSVVAPWIDGGWLVGGLDATGDRPSMLTLYDLDRDRLEPTVWTLSQGVISRLEPDAQGRVWALHGWSGQLTRLAPQ